MQLTADVWELVTLFWSTEASYDRMPLSGVTNGSSGANSSNHVPNVGLILINVWYSATVIWVHIELSKHSTDHPPESQKPTTKCKTLACMLQLYKQICMETGHEHFKEFWKQTFYSHLYCESTVIFISQLNFNRMLIGGARMFICCGGALYFYLKSWQPLLVIVLNIQATILN